jgi:DNA-binding LacI/PurR family transcriptional regulator
MADIARAAGVSESTVSRALADNPLVAKRTRDRIQEIAATVGYVVNPVASGLRSRQSGVIAVAIPLVHEQDQHLSDPFMMTMLALLADALSDRGYNMLLSKVPAHEDGWVRKLQQPGRADGVILIGQSFEHAAINDAARAGLAVVAWGTQLASQKYPSVGTDNRAGGELAARHVLAAGRRRVAFLGDERLPEIGHRFEGYRTALRAHGIRPAASLHVRSHFTSDEAYRAARELCRSGSAFDAIVAASDVIAINAMRAVAESGRRVPQDVSVVGFDDILLAQYAQPALTTVRQDIAAGASALVDTVIAAIRGEKPASVVLAPRLILRDSA